MANQYGARLSHQHRLTVFLVVPTGMALICASCGSSGGSAGSGGGAGGGGAGGSGGRGGDDPTVASVVIEPGTTLLSEVGASRLIVHSNALPQVGESRQIRRSAQFRS
jgi:hypothetical protein